MKHQKTIIIILKCKKTNKKKNHKINKLKKSKQIKGQKPLICLMF